MSAMSELPEFLHQSALRRLDDFCRSAGHHPTNPRRLDYRITGLQVHLFEVRRGTSKTSTTRELPMAQLRFSPELNQWSLPPEWFTLAVLSQRRPDPGTRQTADRHQPGPIRFFLAGLTVPTPDFLPFAHQKDANQQQRNPDDAFAVHGNTAHP